MTFGIRIQDRKGAVAQDRTNFGDSRLLCRISSKALATESGRV